MGWIGPKQTLKTKSRRELAEKRLSKLWARGCEFLGVKYAILGGAMTWVSDHKLVAAISNAGGFGILATGSMNKDQLQSEINLTFKMTSNPFGVNLITMHPDISKLCDVCISSGVSHVVLAGGLPKISEINQLKSGGIKVLGFAPSIGFAKRLIRGGVDAIIIEGAEAGGHVGPVSTGVLAQEILPNMFEVPVFVAGGIGRGETIAMFLEMGASGCQLGTRFVCASESIAHINFKNAFIKARARDAVPSIQIDQRFSVIPVRALANFGSREFEVFQKEIINSFQDGKISKSEAKLSIEKYWSGKLKEAVINGDIINGSLMAGQSVGMVKSVQPTLEIIEGLVEQAIKALERD